MDLLLVATPGGYRLLAQTVLGMLWLQTHFGTDHWPVLAAGHASVDSSSARLIDSDAREAGLDVGRIGIPSPLSSPSAPCPDSLAETLGLPSGETP